MGIAVSRQSKFLSANVARLVAMPALLSALGFDVNERARRCRCLLHGGRNPTSFSWCDDGMWHCFACGEGGDKIDLVRAVLRCSFKDALHFLANLAGVRVNGGKNLQRALARQSQERARLEVAAEALGALEKHSLLCYRHEIRRLERLLTKASQRLNELHAGAPERFPGESEAAWAVLASQISPYRLAVARYWILAFGRISDRARFVLEPESRAETTEQVLMDSGVTTERGGFMELSL